MYDMSWNRLCCDIQDHTILSIVSLILCLDLIHRVTRKTALQEAKAGKRIPLEKMWEGIDAE